MTSETTFIPLNNPDLSTIAPSLIGVDPTITTESIQAASQPLSFDGGSLTIVGNATIGDLSQLSLLPNPNLSNQIVIPQLTVGGTMMANDIILGDNGITKLISDVSGTYIYNNLSITGIINNNDLTTKLNSKATTTELSDLSYTVSNKADQTDLITNYYNKNQINSSLQTKANTNNTYNIAQVDGFLLQKANVSDLNDKVSASNVYLRSEANLTFQTKNDMSNYATTETLINGYATQLELSNKVDFDVFQQQNDINRNNAIQNANSYTDLRVNSISLTPGATGATGPTGPQGTTGTNGIDGSIGPTGATGPVGPQGTTGANGIDGSIGPTGATGPVGANGIDGSIGPTGATGPVGPQGTVGTNGIDGSIGPVGPQGTAGANGIDGSIGPTGATGPAGTNGINGSIGPTGDTGPSGVLSVTITPDASVDTSQNIVASLVSQVLNINYTNLYNKLATFATQTALGSYLTISSASSNYQSKFWVAFEYLNTGPAVNSYGQSTITTASVTNTTGTYVINMPAHPNGNNYGIMVVSRASGIAYANYSGNKSSTQFRVFTYNNGGALANQDFMVHTVP